MGEDEKQEQTQGGESQEGGEEPLREEDVERDIEEGQDPSTSEGGLSD